MQEIQLRMLQATYLGRLSVLRPYPVGAGVGAEATQLMVGVAVGFMSKVNSDLQATHRE